MTNYKRFSALAVCFMCMMALMAQGMKFEPTGTTLEEASAKAKAEKSSHRNRSAHT